VEDDIRCYAGSTKNRLGLLVVVRDLFMETGHLLTVCLTDALTTFNKIYVSTINIIYTHWVALSLILVNRMLFDNILVLSL